MKPIPGYPAYRVTKDGRVYSVRAGRFMKPLLTGRGYLGVSVHGKRMYIHRLVALTFHGKPPTPSHEVAHKNGKRDDNRATNLAWKTRSENHFDKNVHGTMPRPNARLSLAQVQEIRRRYTPRKGVGALAAEFGIKLRQVNRIVRGSQWRNQPAT